MSWGDAAVVISALAALIAAASSWRTHKTVNSRMDEMKDLIHAEGVAEGKELQKQAALAADALMKAAEVKAEELLLKAVTVANAKTAKTRRAKP